MAHIFVINDLLEYIHFSKLGDCSIRVYVYILFPRIYWDCVCRYYAGIIDECLHHKSALVYCYYNSTKAYINTSISI